jgi:hypothetical protein
MKADDRLIDLLLADEEARESGNPKTPEEICADCPELLPEFRKKLAKLHAADAAVAFTDASTGVEGRTAPYENALPAELDSDRYRPLEFLAKGGQGSVFTAEDGEVGRTVALKCLHTSGADDPGVRERFLFEAEVTGRLEHPGIVPVYGLGRDRAGRPYYVMRLIGGATLRDEITEYHTGEKAGAERVVEFRRLLRAFTAVCETLAYAHARGVIHRDLKPNNIMLGEYGETLVLDWGLAKRSNVPDVEGAPNTGHETLQVRDAGTLSYTGLAKGTWAYMPPEQARGEWAKVGTASDVFGLGATLYAILTGHAPYEGGDAMERARAARYSPPRALNSDTPRALEAVCLKAMAPRPEDRYSGAQELAHDVERFLADEPVSAWREPLSVRARRWAKRHRTALAASVVALIVAVPILLAADAALTLKNRDLAGANHDLGIAKAGLEDANADLDRKNQELSASFARARADFERGDRTVRRITSGLDWRSWGDRPVLTAEREAVFTEARNNYREFVARNGDRPELNSAVAFALVRQAEAELGLGHDADIPPLVASALARFAAEPPDDPVVVYGTSRADLTTGRLLVWQYKVGRPARRWSGRAKSSPACAPAHRSRRWPGSTARTHPRAGSPTACS